MPRTPSLLVTLALLAAAARASDEGAAGSGAQAARQIRGSESAHDWSEGSSLAAGSRIKALEEALTEF